MEHEVNFAFVLPVRTILEDVESRALRSLFERSVKWNTRLILVECLLTICVIIVGGLLDDRTYTRSECFGHFGHVDATFLCFCVVMCLRPARSDNEATHDEKALVKIIGGSTKTTKVGEPSVCAPPAQPPSEYRFCPDLFDDERSVRLRNAILEKLAEQEQPNPSRQPSSSAGAKFGGTAGTYNSMSLLSIDEMKACFPPKSSEASRTRSKARKIVYQKREGQLSEATPPE